MFAGKFLPTKSGIREDLGVLKATKRCVMVIERIYTLNEKDVLGYSCWSVAPAHAFQIHSTLLVEHDLRHDVV